MNAFRTLLTSIILLCNTVVTFATDQTPSGTTTRPGGDIMSGAASKASIVNPDEVVPQAPVENTKRLSSAWTLMYPLGEHKEATIDTALYNYQRIAIPAMASDAMATTGNLGCAGLNMIFKDRPHYGPFFFDRSLSFWLPSLTRQKFYNVYVPMTLLSYNFGGNRDNHTDRLTAQFAGNVNRNIGVAAFVDYLYSKGCYKGQASKDFLYGGNVYYTGHRYEMQVLFNAFNFLNKENGGITDPLYIIDPAQLQGGDSKVEPQSIPVNLSAAHSRMTGSRFFTTQAYKIGFWKEEVVNDTLKREVYVPVTKFIYSLDYETRRHIFKNTNATEADEFFSNTYLNPYQTYDNTHYWHLANTIGVQMIEGFQNWAKFGLSAYASYQVRRYTQPPLNLLPEMTLLSEEEAEGLTPIPENCQGIPGQTTQNLLFVGGRLEKTKGDILKYNAEIKFGIIGAEAGDIDAKGNISTDFKLFGDTVSINANARFSNLEPSFLLKEYVSNHFIWRNNFGKTQRFGAGGTLLIPWTNTTLSVDFESIRNYIYFNPLSVPAQYGSTLSVFTAGLHQELHFGIWNWNNTITYQASTNQDVLPLPQLSVYSNMYLAFKAFRVLDLQIGIDCDYFTRYRGMTYQPATMAFCVQDKKDAFLVGNYPLCNAYITAKLYKVRFFVLWSHVNQGLFSKQYFSMPGYPIDPRRLQFGLCVDFAN